MRASSFPSEPLEGPAALGARVAGAGRATWPTALVLLAVVLFVRLIYLIWLSPYELAADEAYYWQQGRHLDWCYSEKGPVLAWTVALCTRLFGDTEWAVRLPVLVAYGLAAWGVGRLAVALARGDERAGFFAVVAFLLIPAYAGNSQFCTQDGLLLPVLVALTALGLRLFRRWRAGLGTWREWLLLWMLLGVAMLVKQPLFLLGIAVYVLLARRSLRFDWTFLVQQLAGIAVFLAVVSPMILWNRAHGWPMLSHTLGHMAGAGDQAGHVNKGNPLLWVGSTVGGLAAAIGPGALILMIWASRRAMTTRVSDDERWFDRLWIMCAAWPPVLFFVLLSFFKPVIASWPLASAVPLVALAAEFVMVELPRRLSGAAGEPREGPTAFHRVWGFTIVYGIAGILLLSFPTPLARLPVVGARFEKSLVKRIKGHREAAADLRQVLESLQTPDGRPPRVVTRHYSQAVLYSFYLSDHQVVSTAGKYLGRRATTLDVWDDTRLDNPDLLGRSLLLVNLQGNVPRARAKILANVVVPWEAALRFDEIKPVDEGRFALATNFRGPRADHVVDTGDDTDEP